MVTVTGQVTLPDATLLPVTGPVPVMAVGVDIGPTAAGGSTAAAIPGHLAMFPAASISRVFRAPGKGLPGWTAGELAALPSDVEPHVSWRDYDLAAFTAWLDARPAGKWRRVTLTYWHEADRAYMSTTSKPSSSFQSEWARYAEILNARPDRAAWRLAAVHTGYWSRQAGNDWRIWWPPAADTMSWDVYNDNWLGVYVSPATLLDVCIAAAAEVDRPWMLSEFGSIRMASDPDGAARAQWITDMVRYARGRGCASASWWCALGSQQGWDYHLDNCPNEQAAWRQVTEGSV